MSASSSPSPLTAKPTSEVVPVTKMITDMFTKDPIFMINAVIAGLAIVYYLIFGSPMDESKKASRTKNGDPNVILVGPSDSGKTTIFTKLVYNEPPQTHTSLSSSTSTLRLDDKSIKISDLPGHPRLRESTQELAGNATAAVFVCDVSTLIRNGPQVAEELPAVLTRLAASSLTSPSAPIPRLLILANKADLLSRSTSTTAQTATLDEKTRSTAIERAKLILTREMDRLKSARGTTSGRIEGLEPVPLTSTSSSFFGLGRLMSLFTSSSKSGGSGGSKARALTEEGRDEAELMIWGQTGKFSWDEIEGVDVQWAASGLTDDGLNGVRDWLSDL